MIEQIQIELAELARREDIRILYAAESGSRAWSFESENSDWDVRFIYARPQDRYLSIKSGPDMVERQLPGDLDFAGWDLPKALGLFAKTNPALLEWLRSPIVYATDECVVAKLRTLEPLYFNLNAGIHHYRSLAITTFTSYLEQGQISLKKYFYCLRPLLACLSLLRTKHWPPTRFDELVEGEIEPGELRTAIGELIAMKRKSSELGAGKTVPVVHTFIEKQLAHLKALELEGNPKVDLEPLNVLFRSTVSRNRS